MIEFKMPSLGADMDEGTLDEWLVKPGDVVTRGQIVAVVETTKAAVEVECWQEGTVVELLVPVGTTVQVGAPLARLAEPGEAAEPLPAPTVEVLPTVEAPPVAEPTPRRLPEAAPAPVAPVVTMPERHRRWISPAARRLAQSLAVDLDAVTGTGPQGAVTINDVEHAAAADTTTAEPAKPVSAPAQGLSPRELAAKRGAEMRRSIAAAMSRSKREIPHYYLAHEIVFDNALNWLSDRNAQRSVTERLLPAVLQLKAVALAARRFGEFNGFWRNDTFEPAEAVHIGVAISLRGGGLVAPAIHDASDKKIDELMADLTDLVARARAFSLRSSEMSDPTITVTNLGDQGVDAVFGVIYPQQVALVGFGRPTQRVRAVDGGIRIATTVQATLAADHRASDGHRGALFLAAIDEALQQPDLLEK
ncbi:MULTISPECIES: dihydrolipoamide acetyltransferase family protein [unclassified Mycobacterium]|uniref:dihydrolipoamide acetyltransferase family protein n=1 Tax=unclassified Mycobacterium TaxID=2642494 RepID=UPI0007FDCC37|nr:MULTISPECIES: dihydrolipoamide acetyltransferase family protein [unclassified Mycobacterium]OBB37341.1 branched-chain alpha-keto acid dehydrogenase subunit E2 [Mycobacterium sp. 852002-51961_SCH5331710]OBH01795.1 branched-chain alpha-keto acid dehydrogenase subunit E2 [Mycobacterium sp. E136]